MTTVAPIDLRPGDLIHLSTDRQLVVTRPERAGAYVRFGLRGIDTDYVAYLPADEPVRITRGDGTPERPLSAVRHDEREWREAGLRRAEARG